MTEFDLATLHEAIAADLGDLAQVDDDVFEFAPVSNPVIFGCCVGDFRGSDNATPSPQEPLPLI